MTAVTVLILHPAPAVGAGELEMWVAAGRAGLAERHRVGFSAAGASEVTVLSGPPDGLAFGARLQRFMAERPPAGLVVLGSGAIPLATNRDRRQFVDAAAAQGRVALANNRFSADVIAIPEATGPLEPAGGGLAELAALATDNALPRWLEERAGYEVADLRSRWRLSFDIDGALDLILLGRRGWLPRPPQSARDGISAVGARLDAIRAVTTDPRREIVVAGRLSAAGLAWLEGSTASRTRALIEERGFRTRPDGQRPARSALGLLLDRDGPEALGTILAELGDAAIVDTRVLLAHRLGTDETSWPAAEDRFASDLLLVDRVADPWLRALTAAARDASIPVVLGGHSLVGPGLRMALSGDRAWT